MQMLIEVGTVVLGYIIGSIPFGLLIVKLKTGKDIREVESGRTGGTNAVRAAGFGAGLLTAILDIFKGASAVWIAQWVSPGNHLLHVLAPVAAILGHNYSIFLVQPRCRWETTLSRWGRGRPCIGRCGRIMGMVHFPSCFPLGWWSGSRSASPPSPPWRLD